MRRSILGLVVVTLFWSYAAFGQSTAITYQGQLKQAGVPVNGGANLEFSLWDADADGNLIAGPLSHPGTPVTNGLFSVQLDFPPEVFSGTRLWLEVAIDDVPLTPRQEITPVPYALSVPGLASNTAGVEVAGDMHATGEVIASAFSSNSPLIFKVNPANVECARFDDANCFLGLGTDMPQARLHIGGVAGVDGVMFPDGSLMTTAAGLGGGGGGFWTGGGANIFNNNGGNVGIGRINPTFKLDVNASNGFGARIGMQAAGGGALVVASNPGDNRVYLEGYNSTDNGSATEMLITGYAGGVLPQLTISAAKVGIGTATPDSKLDIEAMGDGVELLRFTTERPWVFRQIRTGPSAGLQLLSTVGQKAFEITTVEGINVATFLADGGNSKVGIGTTAPTSKLDIVGQDGLGITGFQPFLTLVDSNAVNTRARIQNVNGNFNFFTEAGFASVTPSLSMNHFTTETHCADFRMGHVSRRGSPGRALVDNGDHLVVNFSNDWSYTYVPGRLKVGLLEITGADVAEKFLSSDENVEPGTVMEIDPDKVGRLRVAREAYSSRVAGVVSGAGDIPLGAVLGNLPGHEDAPPIALSGRVWVRCDAHDASIAAGDLLTTSNSPGHAMKASDWGRCHGAILGKAMSPLAMGEQGLVLVLVNLQ